MSDWEIVPDTNNGDWEIVSEAKPKRTGLKGVAEDVLSGIKDVPGAVWDLAKSLPGEAVGAGAQIFTDPKRIGQNALAGLASGGRGLLNLPGNTVDYLKERELAPAWLEAARPESINDFDYRKGVGLEGQQSGDALIHGLAEFAPNIAPALGNPSIAMGLQAAGQNHNPITAALIPSAIKGAAKVAKGVANIPLTPSGFMTKYVKNNISLSELADNFRAAEGTDTPLGDVIQSPKLKKLYENKLAEKAPWEVEQTYKRINEQIANRAEELVDKTLGENAPSGDANIFVKDLLSKAYEDTKVIKNNLYNDVNKRALAEDFHLSLPKFNKLIDNDLQAIAQSPMFLADKQLLGAFNELIAASGKRPTISGAKYFASKFESEAQALKNPDATSRGLKSLYERTANTLREDVRNQVSTKGSDALKKEFETAESFYKDEFVQFLDKDLYKLLDEGKDAQAIVRSIINPSKKLDKYTMIEKVQKLFPKEQKNVLGYSYLKSAVDNNGVLQPTQVNNLIKALGPRQFNALFPDAKIRQAVMDFSRLRNMNVEAANYLLNPKTGARGQTFLKEMMNFIPEALGGGLAVTGGLGTIGSLLGITGMHLLKNSSNKYLARILTDPNFRVKVADKIIKEKGNKK